MNPEKTYARSPAAVATEVDGRLVALNVERGVCYGLNAVASRIWSLIDTPSSIGDLVAALTDDYEVDVETCRADVEELLRDLEESELVVVKQPGQA